MLTKCFQLKRDDPLLVHNIKEMDVVLVVKKARNNNNNIFKSFEAPHQDEHESSKSAPKGESAGLFKSKYFEVRLKCNKRIFISCIFFCGF